MRHHTLSSNTTLAHWALGLQDSKQHGASRVESCTLSGMACEMLGEP